MAATIKRSEHKKAQQKRIVDAALKIATEEGWENMSMRKISKVINYSLPVLYFHYKSKEDIIQHVAVKGYTKLNKCIQKCLKEAKSFEAGLIRVAREYVNFAITDKILYEAMFGTSGAQTILKDDRFTQGEELFNSLIKSSTHKFNSEVKAEVFIKIIWAFLHGMVTLHYIDLLDNKKTNVAKDMIFEQFLVFVRDAVQ